MAVKSHRFDPEFRAGAVGIGRETRRVVVSPEGDRSVNIITAQSPTTPTVFTTVFIGTGAARVGE